MDIIYNFVGIVFAWSIIGLLLFPIITYADYLLANYLSYATKGEFEYTSPIRKLWDKIFSWTGSSFGGWFYYRDLEFIPIMAYILSYIMSIIGIVGVIAGGKLFSVAIGNAFALLVSVGNFMAPVLLLISAIICVTYLSRKVFGIKQTLANHMKDKNAHN